MHQSSHYLLERHETIMFFGCSEGVTDLTMVPRVPEMSYINITHTRTFFQLSSPARHWFPQIAAKHWFLQSKPSHPNPKNLRSSPPHGAQPGARGPGIRSATFAGRAQAIWPGAAVLDRWGGCGIDLHDRSLKHGIQPYSIIPKW
jgi:hypothetical protein